MSSALLISIRLHDGRYHGAGDWPPSPARLFQALMAGAGMSGPLGKDEFDALRWLENGAHPLVAAPTMRDGQSLMFYMPNNDLDAVGGDPRRTAEIRSAKKIVKPRLFDATIPFMYAWSLWDDEDRERESLAICVLAERLYQFGRGVDMAWAWGEVLDDERLDDRLSNYPGQIHRPSGGGSGRTLACPTPGSLRSLKDRYAAGSLRFKTEGQGKTARQLFSQPPKPRFVQVTYDSPPSRRVYELRENTTEASLGMWPLVRASRLVEWLRDGAVERLRLALPNQHAEIERVLVGRKADGADGGPTSSRVKIVPLASIGHRHADHGIRRVLVEVPAGYSVRADDVHWAFSGLELIDPTTGEDLDLILTPSSDEIMLAHYGAADRARFRVWRTVTPVVLPLSARWRRIEPTRMAPEAKGGAERAAEQAHAAAAVTQALRHAEVKIRAEAIQVQREPFEAKGERVEAFAPGTRFAKERLWHVEITFNASVAGPLVIGDGRFLGLGVMAPVQRSQGIHAFVVEDGLAVTSQPTEVARALRRAVMARVQQALGSRVSLPTFVSGHEADGSPARTQRSHLTFAFDPMTRRLLVLAPHVVERREPRGDEIDHLATLDSALVDFRELRAGTAGLLKLRATLIDEETDSLFTASRTWESVTPYQVTRHTKQVGAAKALSLDLRAECRHRGLPEPVVTPTELHGMPGVGLIGRARLVFAVAVRGPILLGKSRYSGGGLFTGTGG